METFYLIIGKVVFWVFIISVILIGSYALLLKMFFDE